MEAATSLPLVLRVDGRSTGLVVWRARGFLARAVGLWGLPSGHGPFALELHPCEAVHTFALQRCIDVAFVDDGGRVLRSVPALVPWRVARQRGACATWELPAGSCAAFGLSPGARLQVGPEALR